jgi:hypothetical protein
MQQINFPKFSGIRCLMMPYIQGDFDSVPEEYAAYREIINTVFSKQGDIGFLTIDESVVREGFPHRGKRAKYGRALHTEAGRLPNQVYAWGGGHWGGKANVELERDVKIVLANNMDDTCAIWNTEHEDTSLDGDIGYAAEMYPYENATFMQAGQVEEIGILTPHESVPAKRTFNRQFLRIMSKGVHGREPYFTKNPRM